jgi:membrane carboxypeptidase/penicillin-binding protein
VAAGLARLGIPHLEAALVAIDPRTGNVLAMVGGHDFQQAPFNRATRSRRQPGSAFKPFVYAAALERGLSPISRVSGLSHMEPAGPEEWTPNNAAGETVDSLILREALYESNNRAAVALQRQIGSPPVLTLASHVGLPELPDVPSLALGTGVVTPLDLTAAYAVFPNGGRAVKPRPIVQVIDGDGSEVLAVPATATPVLSAGAAFQMVSMLEDVIDQGTGSRARALGVRFPVGGKTGTTDDFKDAWFIGFSSAVVAGVWVGFDQPASIAPIGYGARIALPIWADFMARTTRLLPPRAFDVPDGLQQETLCRVSHLRAVEGCPGYTEYFKEGDDVPRQLCNLHAASPRQEVRRAVGGIISAIGRGIRSIFGRH